MDGVDDGARPQVDKHTAFDMAVHEIQIDVTLATDDDTETMVVNHERRLLLRNKAKHLPVAVKDPHFAAQIDVFADLFKMRHENVAHPHHVNKSGLLVVHNSIFLPTKIVFSTEKSPFFIMNRTFRTLFPAYG